MSNSIRDQVDELNQRVVELIGKGQYDEALPVAERALELARNLGEEDPDYASSLNNLAGLYDLMGNFAAAEPLYLEARDIYREALGKRNPDYANILNNLAGLYDLMGNFAAAEPLFLEARDIYRETLGEENPDYANILNNLAGLYHSMGNFAAAEPLYLESRDIRRETLGENNPDYANSLHNLAGLYESMGDFAAAKPLFLEARDILRETLGERNPEYTNSLNGLAVLYCSMGNFAAAEPLYLESRDIRRETLGERNPDYATSLNNLAVLYESMGNFAAAKPLYLEARDILREVLGERNPDYANILSNLAGLYESMGNFAAAEPLYLESRDILQEALGEKHPDYASSLNNLAELYRSMGNFAAAKPLYLEARDIRREKLGEKHPDYASSLNSLAALYDSMGNFAAAEPLLLEARDIRREKLGEKHPDYATSLNNLATLYKAMGNFAAAEPLYLEARDIRREKLGEKHPSYAASLNDLAGLYLSKKNFAAAEPLYLEARDIRREAVGEKHPDYAGSLNGLALLYLSMGNFAAAEPLYLEARNIRQETLGKRHPDYAGSLNNLAVLFDSMGNFTAAEPLYLEARDIWRETLGKRHPDYASSLKNLATLLAATSRQEEGLELIDQAITIENGILGQVFSISSERQRASYLETLRPSLEAFLSLALQLQTPQAKRRALDQVLRRKAVGAEALAIQRDAVLGGRYPELKPQLLELTTWRSQIAQKRLAGPGPEGLEAHERLLEEWREKKERLESDLARQIPEMNLAKRLEEVNRQVVALALPEGSTLVEFVRFHVYDFTVVPMRWKPARYVAFVLPAGEPEKVEMVDLGEADAIDRMIATFRQSILGTEEKRATESRSSPPGSGPTDLWAKLFQPLLPALGGCKDLILAPDGDLTQLPFEVILTPERKRLIEDYRIHYLSTGRDILRVEAQSSGEASDPLVGADPLFELELGAANPEIAPPQVQAEAMATRHSRELRGGEWKRFTPLPHSGKEGEKIAELLQVEALLKDQVLESRIKSWRSPKILHLATHGFFLPDQQRDPNEAQHQAVEIDRLSQQLGQGWENPLLRSGLALAGAQTWVQGREERLPPEAEDGILTAEDVTGMDLLSTEMVVLSACDTGVGEVRVGEGVFGLRRSFVLAGAKTLVMSLWKVPDRATAELMVDFYTRLLTGQSRAEALRGAQLEMKKKLPDPLYWGAFILQGDPGPLPIDSSPTTS